MTNIFFYTLTDNIFNILHILAILINCFGWAFSKTLKLNLWLLLLTISSWSILGLFFGIGFCFLTEVHSLALGLIGSPSINFSYLDYLLLVKLKIPISSNTISILSILAVFISLGISIKKNLTTISSKFTPLLLICCLGWIFIICFKGIGFIHRWDDIYISLILIASYTLIGSIFFRFIRKDF